MERNDRQEIWQEVAKLLSKIVQENQIKKEDIGAVIFSSTPDLNAGFPAAGARTLGWNDVPLFGTQEIDNPDGLPKCIRVLLLWDTERSQTEIQHVYLKEAVVLRQDIAAGHP